MTVNIKGHTYEMGRNEFKGIIKQVKSMIPNKPTIIAIEKDGHAEMCNDVFPSQQLLTLAIADWNSKGYKVNYSRGL